ncbi:TetR/AcrR family transcriptional regulator [Streptomyces spiramenti]|uniref:TetR/AcrR family transcriptional regulator n=1 Tax=Streptomyces spiramenti TaxID=2720606 RepID=A0ABX1AKL9_9ACTN|nr:TetR/AcrR family transcriptional regulator [Streptomyces spiramenti]NJP65923.1 TetR/AcrR family transcriptional regulator [Streptomyces spiramenti]
MRAPEDLDGLAPAPNPTTTPAGERLLAAAEELFYGQGIGAVGVDLVAESAGVTKRTLYQRFGSKQELVVAYLGRRAHRWQTMLLAELARYPAGPERALAVFAVAERWAAGNPRGCAFVNAWAELGTSTPAVGDAIREEKRWMLGLFRHLTGDPLVAEHLHLLYEGAHVTATTLGDDAAHAKAGAAARTLLAAAGGAPAP